MKKSAFTDEQIAYALKRTIVGILKQDGIVLICLTIIAATLWDLIGFYSLYAIAAVAAIEAYGRDLR
jgi:hypothetical protein